MRWIMLLTIVLLGFGTAVTAQSWAEPRRGTEVRRDLMDAIRPHIAWQLDAPVEFVVHELRRTGDVAFGMMTAQRPGGRAINAYETPAYRRGQLDPEFSDGTSLQVFYRKSGNTWVAVHWEIGATDVWFASAEMCRAYLPVIPEYCQNSGAWWGNEERR